MEKTIKSQAKTGLLIRGMLPLILFIFSYCAKDNNTDISKGIALVKVNISGTEFNTLENIGLKASSGKSGTGPATNRTSAISFNEDFDLVTEVSVAAQETAPTQKAAKSSSKAAAEINELSPNIKYKLAVYNQDGSYLTERDYVKGQEANTAALNLDGGNTYTFVAYSINSATAIPSITFTDATNKTLANSVVQVNGSDDLMYFKTEMQVTGGTENYLGIVLKHQLCQVTTIVDASQTGYNITAASASYGPHTSSATFSLMDGANTAGSGTPGTINVTFPTTMDALVITGTPTIINANSTAGTLTINTITVGPLSASNLVPFTDLVFEPGVKYDVKFNLVPKDIFLVHAGFSAARINGQIWMRHHLGATGDPDVLGQSIAGNYFQFGRKAVVASGTATATNSNWNGYMAAANAWNSGTEAAPVKTANDPCPAGYRIPTEIEVRALIANSLSTQSGPWSTSRYASAVIMTSKRNKAVKLTIPAQGYFSFLGLANPPYTPGALTSAGSMAIFYSSNGSGGVNYFRSTSTNKPAHFVEPTNNNTKEYSFNIRCIAQ